MAGLEKSARVGRVDDSHKVMAAMRKIRNRNATTETKAKMTPWAYAFNPPLDEKNRSSLSPLEALGDEKVVRRTIPIPALGRKGRIPGNIWTRA